MKINTKKCTPVKDSETCKVDTNPHIPKDKQEEEKEDDYGREVTFIPQVIFTPTLSSKRTHPKPYPRLSGDAMEDLSASISKMLISEDKETKDKKSEEDKKTPRPKEVTKPLGRYEVEVFTESKAIVRVTRSLRVK